MLIFKIQGIVWDLSMMRISFKLGKEHQKVKKMKKYQKSYRKNV